MGFGNGRDDEAARLRARNAELRNALREATDALARSCELTQREKFDAVERARRALDGRPVFAMPAGPYC